MEPRYKARTPRHKKRTRVEKSSATSRYRSESIRLSPDFERQNFVCLWQCTREHARIQQQSPHLSPPTFQLFQYRSNLSTTRASTRSSRANAHVCSELTRAQCYVGDEILERADKVARDPEESRIRRVSALLAKGNLSNVIYDYNMSARN